MQDGTNIDRRAPRRAALAAGAALALLALPAGAAADASVENWKGTVVSADTDRGRFLTAGRDGEIRTVRATRQTVARARVGKRVKVRAVRTTDGTYAAKRIRSLGRTKRARVRGAVIERSRGRNVLSAGGSVFTLRTKSAGRVRSAASEEIGAGDIVVADVAIRSGSLLEQRLHYVGDAGIVELEGLFLDLQDGILQIEVEDRGLVEVAVPADMVIDDPPSPGDPVELLVTIDAEGGFTLVALDADAEGGIDYDVDGGEAKIEGVIESLSDVDVTVRNGAGTLTCALPVGLGLDGFEPGDPVELRCMLIDGALTVTKLESESSEIKYDLEDGEAKIEGIIESLGDVEVTVRNRAGTLTCVVPAGVTLDGFAPGDAVELKCALRDGALVVTKIESESSELELEGEPGHQGERGHQGDPGHQGERGHQGEPGHQGRGGRHSGRGHEEEDEHEGEDYEH